MNDRPPPRSRPAAERGQHLCGIACISRCLYPRGYVPSTSTGQVKAGAGRALMRCLPASACDKTRACRRLSPLARRHRLTFAAMTRCGMPGSCRPDPGPRAHCGRPRLNNPKMKGLNHVSCAADLRALRENTLVLPRRAHYSLRWERATPVASLGCVIDKKKSPPGEWRPS